MTPFYKRYFTFKPMVSCSYLLERISEILRDWILIPFPTFYEKNKEIICIISPILNKVLDIASNVFSFIHCSNVFSFIFLFIRFDYYKPWFLTFGSSFPLELHSSTSIGIILKKEPAQTMMIMVLAILSIEQLGLH